MLRPHYATAILLLAGTAAHAETVELQPIVTTASRLDQPGYAVGSAVTVIEGKDLEQRQIRFVADALRAVPGLAVSRSGNQGSLTQVRIRGAEANMTVVLVDGVKINDPGNDDGVDFSDLLALDVARIEVLRGAQSVLWGSGAMGGVINIITRPGEGKPSLTIDSEGGSRGTSNVIANVSGAGKRYAFNIGGSRYDTHGISTARNQPETDPYRLNAVFGRLRFDPFENLSLSVAGRATTSNLSYDSFPPFDRQDTSSSQKRWVNARARLKLLDGHLENIAQGSILHGEAHYNTFGTVFEGDKRSFSNQTTVFWDTTPVVPLAHRATFLVEHEHSEANGTFSTGGNIQETNNTGYAGEYGVSYDDRLFLTAGARFDHNSRFEDAKTFRVTGAWRFIAAGTRLHTSYGTGVRNPTLYELFGYGGTFVGNPNLSPERARSADIGIEQTLWGGRLVADVTLFRNVVNDLITGSGNTAINLPGTTKINGVELTATAEVTAGLTLDGSYTMMQTQDASGTELTRRPRNVAALHANYAVPAWSANFNAGIEYSGRSRDEDFYAGGTFPYPGLVVDLQPYTLVSFAASYDLTPRVQLHARVENALNQDYEEVIYYGEIGLSAFGGVRVKLGG